MRAGVGAFAPGRVLVGFEAGAGEEGRRAAAVAVDGRVVAGNGRTRVVELDRDADVRAAARRLAGRPGVAYAEPDWVRRVDACDPDVCWHLQPRLGADVLQAHQGGARGAGRTVAVVDTGVAAGVPDLAGRVGERWRCKQFTSPSGVRCEPAQAPPTSPHGTEVASVIGALDNDSGTTGVAPEATVVSYRVDNESGGIPISYLDKALRQIAAVDDVDVVNLSLGGSQWSQTERDAIDAVLAQGKVVVASAGNTGDRIPPVPGPPSLAWSRSGPPTTRARSPASPPSARSTWSPPATAWPWSSSPASTRTAAAPATPGRSPAGPSPRSSPAAPRRSTGRPPPSPTPGTAGDSPAGGYTLRVLYTEPGGRALLRAWTLTVDEQRPRIADATAAPNPFEPRPDDGDRDTTTFAMTSSERGRLRAVIYRYASTEVVGSW